MTADTPGAYEVTRLWRQSGKYYAADVTSAAGGRFTAYFARGQIMWAEPDVWAFPERHGLVRYYCPGHGGAVCQYGACDEIRVSDLARLKERAFPGEAGNHGIRQDVRPAAATADGPKAEHA